MNATLARTQAVCTILSDEGPGILDHFEWGALAPTQFVNTPFLVSLAAKDIFNDTIQGFTNRVTLSGRTGGGFATTNIFGNRVHESFSNGDFTIGHLFTPLTNILVTHLRHYWGSKISIWTDAGILLATTPVASVAGNWAETPLAAPLQLQAGTHYRLAAYTGGVNRNYYYTSINNFPTNFNQVTLESGVFASGDNFPDLTTGTVLWFGDIRYTVASFLNVPVTPALSGLFTHGVWTGELTVQQTVINLTLLAAETNTLKSGLSSPFDVIVNFNVIGTNDLALRLSVAPEPVLTGQPLTYACSVTNSGPASSTGVRLTHMLPAGLPVLSILPSQGSCSNTAGVIVCDLGDLPGGSEATVTVIVVPQTPGLLTNSISITRNEPDPVVDNNHRMLVSTVLLPALSINDISVTESNAGSRAVTFSVTLSQASTQRVTVAYATTNGTAVSGSDYAVRSGTLTFQAGVTTQNLAISIIGDTAYESNEFFFVNLSNPSNAMLAKAQGVCTILNDDTPPSLTLSNATVIEGNFGITNARFAVRLSAIVNVTVAVDYSTADDTAAAGSDYVATAGTLIFPAGSSNLIQFITVPVLGDLQGESNETFFVNLSNPANATLLTTQAVGTILTDEGAGILDHFEWSALAPTQLVNAPFPVTLTAQDFVGGTMTNFTGPVTLSGFVGGGNATNNILGNRAATNTFTGDFTIGYSFTPRTNMTVSHFRHYCGTKISLWTDAGALLASTLVSSLPGTWLETPLPRPLQLTAGTLYRIAFYTGGTNGPYYFDGATQPTDFTHATILEGKFAFGDDFPTNSTGPALWYVDMRYTVAALLNVPIQPTLSANFTNGIWTGAITVLQAATNLTLRATDATNHRGDAGPLNVLPPVSDLALTLTDAPDPVAVSNSLTYTISVLNRGPSHATALTVTDRLPPGVRFVSAVSSNGSCGSVAGLVTCNLTNLPSGSRATLALLVTPQQAGTLTNTATVTVSGATDPLARNNTATVLTTVFSDRDQDGMPDQWEVDNGLNPDDASDASLDPDSDGMTNLQEYQAGTNPHDAASVLRITRVEMIGREMHIFFTGVSGRRYRIERMVDGTPPTWVPVLDYAAGATTEMEVIDLLPDGETTRLYRVRLLLP